MTHLVQFALKDTHSSLGDNKRVHLVMRIQAKSLTLAFGQTVKTCLGTKELRVSGALSVIWPFQGSQLFFREDLGGFLYNKGLKCMGPAQRAAPPRESGHSCGRKRSWVKTPAANHMPPEPTCSKIYIGPCTQAKVHSRIGAHLAALGIEGISASCSGIKGSGWAAGTLL